jgi:protein-disulfide isomerase
MTPRRFLALILGLAVAGVVAFILSARRGAIPSTAHLRVNPEGLITWSVGSDDAPVEVWEGSDYQCPDCVRYEAEEMPEIRRRFIETGKVRWRYLLFALPTHAEAGPATHAFACAREQGDSAAGVMHRSLFQTQPQWAKSAGHLDVFRGIAASNGMDVDSYDGCMASGRYRDAVAKTWAEAQRVGFPGTPTVLLYGRFYVGGLTANQLDRVLDRPPEQAGRTSP